MKLPQTENEDFWAPRHCLLEPIPEIFQAVRLLDSAIDAHVSGDQAEAAHLIKQADIPEIVVWTEALWGPKSVQVHRLRQTANSPPVLPASRRVSARMPTLSSKRKLIERDGYHCRYCGIPVIDEKVRKAVMQAYPDELRWGRKNSEQHSAFQCMWLTYDHVLPYSRGGDNSYENIVVCCQPCNCGKEDATLSELGLIDPRTVRPRRSEWDGLERFIRSQC